MKCEDSRDLAEPQRTHYISCREAVTVIWQVPMAIYKEDCDTAPRPVPVLPIYTVKTRVFVLHL